MAVFVYQGMTEKAKKAAFEAQRKGIGPQDKRGEEIRYTILAGDSESLKEEKRRLVAKWIVEAEKQIKDGIEKQSQEVSISGVTFPVGKEVTVEDESAVCKKLLAICKQKGSQFKLIEKVKKEEK